MASLSVHPCRSTGSPCGCAPSRCPWGCGWPPPPDAPPIPGVTRAHAATVYAGLPRELILNLKIRGRRRAAGPLAAAMVRALHASGTAADLVAWVPGRRADIRRRGYDHAHILARAIGRATGLPPVPVLHRVRANRDQTALGRAERWANLSGVFSARGCAGTRILLVDDLVTTGATAAACAQALERAGARSVDVLVACAV